MIRRIPILALFLVGLVAAPALAQSSDAIIEEAISNGFYVDDTLGAANRTSEISDQIARAGNAGVRLVVVLLDDNPSGGAVTFADNVLDEISGGGTVLVLSASQEAIVSDVFDDATGQRAVDRGFDASSNASDAAGAGDVAFITGVVDVLTGSSGSGSSGTTTSGGTSDGGGGSGFLILLIIVGVIVLIVWLLVRSGKKAGDKSAQGRVEEARAEIKEQIDLMANTILEITDQVRLSDPEEDNVYLEAAGNVYTEVLEAFESAQDLQALEAISDRLDDARWQLAAAEAISEGNEPPAKPEPQERAACFFDPTHVGPYEDAEVTTAAGKKTVRVCRKDADLLRKGEEARPRMIQVDGRSVPAPSAPRSHGGGGFDLGTAISILVGGMADRRSYDWGGTSASSRRRGPWGGGGSASTSSGRGGASSSSRGSTSGSRSRTGRSRGRKR